MLTRVRPENFDQVIAQTRSWNSDDELSPEEDLLTHTENEAIFCVTEKDETLVGMMIIAQSSDENWHLTRLCIHPDHRNKGHGTKLLNLLTEHLDSLFQECSLEVNHANTGAKRLYERFNFKETIQDPANFLDYGPYTPMHRDPDLERPLPKPDVPEP